MNRRNFISNALTAAAVPSLQFQKNINNETRKRVMRVAHLTDIHVQADKVAEEGMARALQSVQQLNPKADFLINGGDAIMDALERNKDEVKQQWAIFKSIMKAENSLPTFHVIGNHDIFGWFNKTTDLKGDPQYGKAWAVDELNIPKRYYSFERLGWKFIFLDSVQLNPAGGYVAYVDGEQMQWLKQELANTAPTKHICIVSHIPIFSACSALFYGKVEQNGDLITKRNIMHTDFFKLKNLFKNHSNIRLCVSGHVHLQDEVKYLGITYYCNGAVCGNWWKGPYQDFPPAYAVLDFYDDGSFERKFVQY
jgi:3',5'-cyclic-AMP phosphodiesterase